LTEHVKRVIRHYSFNEF